MWTVKNVKKPEADAVTQEYLDELTQSVGHTIYPVTEVITQSKLFTSSSIFKLSEKGDIYFRDDKVSYLIFEANTKDLGNFDTVDEIEFYDEDDNIIPVDTIGTFLYGFDIENRKVYFLIPVIWVQPGRLAQTGSRNVTALIYVSRSDIEK